MQGVRSVAGSIALTALGPTLSHEHIVIASPGMRESYPDTYDRAAIVELAISQMRQLRRQGIRTILDHTTYDLGRDVDLLATVSRMSRINIVCATGVWESVPRFFQLRKPAEVAELFVRDIEVGVAGTGIRAGFVKCAVDAHGLNPYTEIIALAAALTQRATGVPISTHTDARSESGIELLDVLERAGAQLSRVVVGHSGDTDDMSYLLRLLDRGCYLGMDRFGVEETLADGERVEVVAELCRRGHASQLLLSHDSACWSDRMSEEARVQLRPHWVMSAMHDRVLPALARAGVSKAQLQTMLIENPRRLFG